MKPTPCEFTIQDLVPIGITFVVAAIVMGYGATILGNIGDSVIRGQTETAICNISNKTDPTGVAGCGYAYNQTLFGNRGINSLASNLPLLAVIIIAAVIIGVLIVYLGGALLRR